MKGRQGSEAQKRPFSSHSPRTTLTASPIIKAIVFQLDDNGSISTCSKGLWTFSTYGLGTLQVLISFALAGLLGAVCGDGMGLMRRGKRRKGTGWSRRGRQGSESQEKSNSLHPHPVQHSFSLPHHSQSLPHSTLTDICLCALMANGLYRPKYGVNDTPVFNRPRSRGFAWCGLWG